MRTAHTARRAVPLVTLFALAVLAGCHDPYQRGETFEDGDHPTPIGRMNQAQAAAGAKQDATLYDRHFRGDHLDPLGQGKLDLMLKGTATGEPVQVYLDMPADLAAARRPAVAAYLQPRRRPRRPRRAGRRPQPRHDDPVGLQPGHRLQARRRGAPTWASPAASGPTAPAAPSGSERRPNHRRAGRATTARPAGVGSGGGRTSDVSPPGRRSPHMRPRPTLAWVALCLAAAAPATEPAESARLDRGARLRAVLLDTLEQAYAHGNVWPDRPVAADPTWAYQRPTPVPDADAWRTLAAAAVVLHERRPDGSWVGYADGHLEFAPDAAALDACGGQMSLATRAAAVTRADRAATRPAGPPAAGTLHVRVTDAAGQPVPAASVGTYGSFGDLFPNRPPGFTFAGTPSPAPIFTDGDGRAAVPAAEVFAAKFAGRPTAPVWVATAGDALMAEVDVRRSDLAAGTDVHVTVRPACRVSGRVTCLAGRAVTATFADVACLGPWRWYTVTAESHGDRFALPLPPGDWRLDLYTDGTPTVARYVHVAGGRRTLDLQIDLPPAEAATHFGQPAPELRQIKAWRNGGPTTLAALRGRVVLLDFWGYWCGPCVASMPELMKLHDEFGDRGLTIIAVHDDSAATMADVDAKCADARRRYWGGRDLPFLIALDGGGKVRIRHSADYDAGATTAAYGITAFPTTLLIDRAGTLVGDGDPRDPGLRAQIVRLLAEPARP